MLKAIVFGATPSALDILKQHQDKYEIVAFTDNDPNKWGNFISGKPVISPDRILDYEYERIVIVSFSALDVIKKQLISMGIEEGRIDGLVEQNIRSRLRFLQDFARICRERNITGSVAEVGVFQGEFAKEINRFFPNEQCYLFDTFEGFDKRDVEIEQKYQYSVANAGHLANTSVELVMSKMPNPDRVIIKKGYFPETGSGIQDSFKFVNMDLDLYKPTIDGLIFFWPMMVKGGIVVVHDYFSNGYEGINAAVREFEEFSKASPFPIGDGWSVAFQKN